MAIKYTNIYLFQGSQKYNQIGISAVEIFNLATLIQRAWAGWARTT
jgi:hypothetical protein